jgi:hypothetical protein
MSLVVVGEEKKQEPIGYPKISQAFNIHVIPMN